VSPVIKLAFNIFGACTTLPAFWLKNQLTKVGATEIVPVDIELYPSSTFFEAGETLQLIIASDEIIPTLPYKKDVSCNHGEHVLHFGGNYNPYLLVPKIRPSED
jgi:predicted acyl esterase